MKFRRRLICASVMKRNRNSAANSNHAERTVHDLSTTASTLLHNHFLFNPFVNRTKDSLTLCHHCDKLLADQVKVPNHKQNAANKSEYEISTNQKLGVYSAITDNNLPSHLLHKIVHYCVLICL